MTIFIFKSNALGMQYGMGTYIRELIDAILQYTDHKVYLISYNNTKCNEYNIKTPSPNYVEVSIPSPKLPTIPVTNIDKRYANGLMFFLSNILENCNDVIFHFNCSDAIELMKLLKKKYPFPILSVAHFAQWQLLFNGNRKKLNDVNFTDPKTNIDKSLSRDKEMYTLSDHIITVTRYMKQFLEDIYAINSNNITHIPNGISTAYKKEPNLRQKSKIRRSWGFDDCEIIILFTGRIDEAKGVYFLLNAFNKACKELTNLRLVLAGNGIVTKAMQKIKSHHGKVVFTEFLPKEKINELYTIADIGVLTSLFDQCPYTVLEMLSYKLPVIISRIPGIDEIYSDGQCKFIDPVYDLNGDISYNTDILKSAIIELAKNKKYRINMGQKAYKEIYDMFQSKIMIDKLNVVYSNLLRV